MESPLPRHPRAPNHWNRPNGPIGLLESPPLVSGKKDFKANGDVSSPLKEEANGPVDHRARGNAPGTGQTSQGAPSGRVQRQASRDQPKDRKS